MEYEMDMKGNGMNEIWKEMYRTFFYSSRNGLRRGKFFQHCDRNLLERNFVRNVGGVAS